MMKLGDSKMGTVHFLAGTGGAYTIVMAADELSRSEIQGRHQHVPRLGSRSGQRYTHQDHLGRN
jgi:hypothetical protein